jgi:hypothetical protein
MYQLKSLVEKVKKAQLRHSPGSPIADKRKTDEDDYGPAAGGWDSHSGLDDEDE